MAISSPYVYQSGNTLYDLRKVSSWTEPTPQTAPTSVLVRFIDTPDSVVQLDKVSFEAQMQLSQAAGGA